MPAITEVLQRSGLIDKLAGTVQIFHQQHCSEMIKHDKMKKLVENFWDTYRDLKKVWDTDFCRENGFDAENTLIVDCELPKVQLWLQNALVISEYTIEDVEGGLSGPGSNSAS